MCGTETSSGHAEYVTQTDANPRRRCAARRKGSRNEESACTMKKIILALTLFAVPLAGCSAVEEVNRSVGYTSDAVAYINDASQWAQDIPQLAQNAVNDPQAQEKLSQELDQVQQSIADFGKTEVPGFAQGLHEQLTGYNASLNTQVDELQQRIEAGEFTPELLQNSEVMQTIQNIQGLMDQFQQLGQ